MQRAPETPSIGRVATREQFRPDGDAHPARRTSEAAFRVGVSLGIDDIGRGLLCRDGRGAGILDGDWTVSRSRVKRLVGPHVTVVNVASTAALAAWGGVTSGGFAAIGSRLWVAAPERQSLQVAANIIHVRVKRIAGATGVDDASMPADIHHIVAIDEEALAYRIEIARLRTDQRAAMRRASRR